MSARLSIEPGEEPDAPGTPITLFELELAVESFGGPHAARAMWEACVLIGAVRELSAGLDLPPVSFNATLVAPDGTRKPRGGGLGAGRGGRVFDPITPEIRQNVTARARAAGLTDVETTVIRAIQEALVISASAPDPRAVIERMREAGGVLRAILGGPPARYEGVYFELRDRYGKPVYAAAAASRAGVGSAWADPALGVRVGHRLELP